MLNRLFPFSDSAPQASRGLRTVLGVPDHFPGICPQSTQGIRTVLGIPGHFVVIWSQASIPGHSRASPRNLSPTASKSTRGIRTMVGIPGHFPVILQASQGIRTTSGIPSQLSPLSAHGYSPTPPRGPLSHARAQAVIPRCLKAFPVIHFWSFPRCRSHARLLLIIPSLWQLFQGIFPAWLVTQTYSSACR